MVVSSSTGNMLICGYFLAVACIIVEGHTLDYVTHGIRKSSSESDVPTTASRPMDTALVDVELTVNGKNQTVRDGLTVFGSKMDTTRAFWNIPPGPSGNDNTSSTTSTVSPDHSHSSHPSNKPTPPSSSNTSSTSSSNKTTTSPTTTTSTSKPSSTTPTSTTPTSINTTTTSTSTSMPTTASAPTSTPTPDAPFHRRHFDGPSFVGGMILSLGLVVLGYTGLRFYKSRSEQNYHTV